MERIDYSNCWLTVIVLKPWLSCIQMCQCNLSLSGCESHGNNPLNVARRRPDRAGNQKELCGLKSHLLWDAVRQFKLFDFSLVTFCFLVSLEQDVSRLYIKIYREISPPLTYRRGWCKNKLSKTKRKPKSFFSECYISISLWIFIQTWAQILKKPSPWFSGCTSLSCSPGVPVSPCLPVATCLFAPL